MPWSSARATRASFDSAAPMKPTGQPTIAAGRGAPVDQHLEQVEQRGRGVADSDHGALEVRLPEGDGSGACGSCPTTSRGRAPARRAGGRRTSLSRGQPAGGDAHRHHVRVAEDRRPPQAPCAPRARARGGRRGRGPGRPGRCHGPSARRPSRRRPAPGPARPRAGSSRTTRRRWAGRRRRSRSAAQAVRCASCASSPRARGHRATASPRARRAGASRSTASGPSTPSGTATCVPPATAPNGSGGAAHRRPRVRLDRRHQQLGSSSTCQGARRRAAHVEEPTGQADQCSGSVAEGCDRTPARDPTRDLGRGRVERDQPEVAGSRRSGHRVRRRA